MRHTGQKNRLSRIEGYILIPHELLHVVGYRLAGKQCHYHWANPYVTPVKPVGFRQDLVGMLFPFAVFLTLVVISAIFTGFAAKQAVQEGEFLWFVAGLIITQIAAVYVGTTVGDLRRAYLLVFKKPWHSWTPFDFFYLPIIDWNDIRKQVEARDRNVKQN